MAASEHAGRSRHRPVSRPRTPPAYRICDGITEGVLYGMIVFAPWAFGTTERWSIWTMNVGGYVLGLLLAAKRSIRWRAGYRPVRWSEGGSEDAEGAKGATQTGGKRKRNFRGRTTIALAVLTPTTDVFSLGVVAVPAALIFEGSLAAGSVLKRFRARARSGEQT